MKRKQRKQAKKTKQTRSKSWRKAKKLTEWISYFCWKCCLHSLDLFWSDLWPEKALQKSQEFSTASNKASPRLSLVRRVAKIAVYKCRSSHWHPNLFPIVHRPLQFYWQKHSFNKLFNQAFKKFHYLGVCFNHQNRLNGAQKSFYDKASRAMFGWSS